MRTQSTVCFGFAVLAVLPLVTSLSAAGPEHAPKPPLPPFAKDGAPILYGNHRAGDIAPMWLLTYAEGRPYAKAVRDEVGGGNMPPWHAAWYDNSSGNKDNPTSKVDVKWGDQTWEEMQYTGLLFSPVAQPEPITDTKPGRGRP